MNNTGGRAFGTTFGLVFGAMIIASSLIGGCSPEECLPVPDSDTTPPKVLVVIEYREHEQGQLLRREIGREDTVRIVRTHAGSLVRASFVAVDSSGVRSLSPGITIQYTVGVGVERRYIAVDPVRAGCPTLRLEYDHEVPGTGEKRVVLLSVASESWAGPRSSLEPISIRME